MNEEYEYQNADMKIKRHDNITESINVQTVLTHIGHSKEKNGKVPSEWRTVPEVRELFPGWRTGPGMEIGTSP